MVTIPWLRVAEEQPPALSRARGREAD